MLGLLMPEEVRSFIMRVLRMSVFDESIFRLNLFTTNRCQFSYICGRRLRIASEMPAYKELANLVANTHRIY